MDLVGDSSVSKYFCNELLWGFVQSSVTHRESLSGQVIHTLRRGSNKHSNQCQRPDSRTLITHTLQHPRTIIRVTTKKSRFNFLTVELKKKRVMTNGGFPFLTRSCRLKRSLPGVSRVVKITRKRVLGNETQVYARSFFLLCEIGLRERTSRPTPFGEVWTSEIMNTRLEPASLNSAYGIGRIKINISTKTLIPDGQIPLFFLHTVQFLSSHANETF